MGGDEMETIDVSSSEVNDSLMVLDMGWVFPNNHLLRDFMIHVCRHPTERIRVKGGIDRNRCGKC